MTEELKFGGASPDAPPPVVREVNYEQKPPNGEVEGSLLSQLRNAATAQQKMHIKDFRVGGEFRNQLWIRYQPLDPGPMDRFITRRSEVRDLQEQGVNMPYTELSMDLMAQACTAVVGADPDGENKTVLEDEYGQVKLEKRLAVLLNMPVPAEMEITARDVIMLLFGGNAMAIIDHGDDLMRWLNDPTEGPDPSKL
jgi:hypothetical protein